MDFAWRPLDSLPTPGQQNAPVRRGLSVAFGFIIGKQMGRAARRLQSPPKPQQIRGVKSALSSHIRANGTPARPTHQWTRQSPPLTGLRLTPHA